MKLKNCIKLAVVAACCAPAFAFATNGYFSHGYGLKAKGMAGVGIALPQDALAAATNPAGMVMLGDRIDFGADLFRPVRSTQSTGVLTTPIAIAPAGDFSGNGDSEFLVPEFGYNKMLGRNMAVGVSVYGNGGMNTSYDDINARTFGPVPGSGAFGSGKMGVDFMQLFVAPTFSMKVNEQNAVGVSLNLAYQRIKLNGIQNFAGVSNTPTAVSNNGYDSSTGWGVRLGWTGQVSPNVTLGATYQSKTRMGKFDKYAGLFAEQGAFDIPETYGFGIAMKATPQMIIAADLQQINYGKIPTVANSINNLATSCALFGGAGTTGCLGGSNGAGFGWRDMTVLKLGASYEYSQNLTLRGGLSTARQPIPENETFFNVIAPAVIENHLTLGATWTLANKSELTVGYMHGFNKTVNGTNTVVGGRGINIKMYQDSIGVAYGWKM